MDKKKVKKYWGKVRRRAWEDAVSRSGAFLLLMGSLIFFMTVVAITGVLYTVGIIQYPFYRDNVVANNITGLAQVIVAIFLIVWFYDKALHEIPPKMHEEQENKIEHLEERLSLKEYEDIDIEFYNLPWTDHELNIGARDFINFLRIGLLVANIGGIKVHCGLRMMLSWYRGKPSNNEWVDNPTPVENKFLKWDEGYEVSSGKIDIAPNGGTGIIKYAEANPYHPEFNFWYVDGEAKNHHLLEGEYKTRIQLEGDSEKEGIVTAPKPVKYDVFFKYERRQLSNVSVSKLPRD